MFFRKKTCRTGSRFPNSECATQYALRGFLAASYQFGTYICTSVLIFHCPETINLRKWIWLREPPRFFNLPACVDVAGP